MPPRLCYTESRKGSIAVAFIGILFMYLILMGMFAIIALGGLGLVLCVVFLLLWNGAKKRGESRQTLFLVLAIVGGALALAGGSTLAAFLFLLTR